MINRQNENQRHRADIWTLLAGFGEGTTNFISDSYWLGGLIDLIFQLDEDILGLSWYGMGFGIGLALITSTGSAYAHSILNVNNQKSSNEEQQQDKNSDLTDENKPLLDHSHHRDHMVTVRLKKTSNACFGR